MFSVGILTISDKGSRGEREDRSGEEIRRVVDGLGFTVKAYEIIPDEGDQIGAGSSNLPTKKNWI